MLVVAQWVERLELAATIDRIALTEARARSDALPSKLNDTEQLIKELAIVEITIAEF